MQGAPLQAPPFVTGVFISSPGVQNPLRHFSLQRNNGQLRNPPHPLYPRAGEREGSGIPSMVLSLHYTQRRHLSLWVLAKRGLISWKPLWLLGRRRRSFPQCFLHPGCCIWGKSGSADCLASLTKAWVLQKLQASVLPLAQEGFPLPSGKEPRRTLNTSHMY